MIAAFLIVIYFHKFFLKLSLPYLEVVLSNRATMLKADIIFSNNGPYFKMTIKL